MVFSFDSFEIMNNIENLKNDIVFINDFATDLFGKTSKLSGRTVESLQKINELVEIEKKNEKFLQGVAESISDAEIKNTEESLEKHIKDMTEKQTEYVGLINKNSKDIAKISGDIRSKKQAIDKIHSMCDELDRIVSLVNKP